MREHPNAEGLPPRNMPAILAMRERGKGSIERPGPRMTLADVPSWYAIIAACRRCERGDVVSKGMLRRFRVKDEDILREAELRLRCTVCRRRGYGQCAFGLKRLPR
jgi:hypothetical protein